MIKLRAEWRGVKEGAELGRLIVLGPQFRIKTRWNCVCRCKCGVVVVARADHLECGNSCSCGCLQRESVSNNSFNKIHGGRNTSLYKLWENMKSRCYNKNCDSFKYYGEIGIYVCEVWINDFPAFRDWALSHGYKPGLQIDREKNNLGYSPDNCRFVTRTANIRNRRNTKMATWKGETKSLAEWSEDSRCVVSFARLCKRLKSGWSFQQALTTRPKSIDT